MYQLRAHDEDDLVKVYYVAVDTNKNFCSKADKAYVLTERIPYRLDSIYDLS